MENDLLKRNNYEYELIDYQEGLPMKIFMQGFFEADYHWHKEIEIILVLKGQLNIKIGSDDYLLEEDDLIVINSNQVHSTTDQAEDIILLVMQIDPSYYNEFQPQLSNVFFEFKPFLEKGAAQQKFHQIRSFLAEIMWELNEKDEAYQLKIKGIINSLVVYLLRNLNYETVDQENVKLQEESLERLQRIINYIDNNYAQEISLRTIAERENLSYYYLSHFFKDKMGISFQKYLNEVRIKKAEPLLRNKEKTITDISYQVGFANPKSFYRVFKNKFDSTPGAYREDLKADSNDKFKEDSCLDFDQNLAFEKLFSYRS